MLAPAVGSLIIINNRKLAQIFPEKLRNLWNDWELRVAVVVSLFMQIILIALGSRRKYLARDWLVIVLWVVYLSADWVVNLSLGVLSNMESMDKNGSVDPKYEIMALWAPLLLIHLGGPDTITAYSLEDNELWMRQLLGLVVKFAGAFYILIKSWTGNPINFIVVSMFLVAVIKCGERTWSLRFASSEQYRKSMLPLPDPGHSYSKFMDNYSLSKAEGYNVSLESVIDETPILLGHTSKAAANGVHPDAVSLHDAMYFFNIFKRLFADLILNFQDLESSRSFFHNVTTTWEKAFNVIDIELGFMYDLLYTKATVTHTYQGSLLRMISLSLTILAVGLFGKIDKDSFLGTDKCITFILLVAAFALQLYEIVILLSSDRTVLWLSRHSNLLVSSTVKTISGIQLWLRSCDMIPAENKRWSNAIAKYNLISFCLKEKPIKFSGVLKLFCSYEMLEKHKYKSLQTVSPELKRIIFEQLLKKSRFQLDMNISKILCAQRGDQVLKEMGCFDDIGWSVETEFDQSILLWHIATDLCFDIDLNKNTNITDNPMFKESKSLSDYMLYLLIMCPFLLPNGIGQIRYQDTCAEAVQFFEEKRHITNREQACAALLEVTTDIPPSHVKGDRSKSVLFDACILAKALQNLEIVEKWTIEKKWEMINHVWVEMLSYAANQCGWNNHAKQLTGGGELLTHVWLLMAHLGITQQFHISKGNARVKLVLS